MGGGGGGGELDAGRLHDLWLPQHPVYISITLLSCRPARNRQSPWFFSARVGVSDLTSWEVTR